VWASSFLQCLLQGNNPFASAADHLIAQQLKLSSSSYGGGSSGGSGGGRGAMPLPLSRPVGAHPHGQFCNYCRQPGHTKFNCPITRWRR
jgi:hypothetical protein